MSDKEPFNPGDLNKTHIVYKNSDINLFSDIDMGREAKLFLEQTYDFFERYVTKDPYFLISYSPVEPSADAPLIAKKMAKAASVADVGPMAAVAGAFSEFLGVFLIEKGAKEVIVENGGDIFLYVQKPRLVGLYAGNSCFSGRIGFRVLPEHCPLSICTSSASVGHSVSLGVADAVCAISNSGALADACATSIANAVCGNTPVSSGLAWAETLSGILGGAIIKGDELAFFGKPPEIIRV